MSWNPSEDRMLERVNFRLNIQKQPRKPKPARVLNKPQPATGLKTGNVKVVITNGKIKPVIANSAQPKQSPLVLKFKKYSKKISKLVTKLSSIPDKEIKKRAFYEEQIKKYKKKLASLKDK